MAARLVACDYCGAVMGEGVGRTGTTLVFGRIACDHCAIESARAARRLSNARAPQDAGERLAKAAKANGGDWRGENPDLTPTLGADAFPTAAAVEPSCDTCGSANPISGYGVCQARRLEWIGAGEPDQLDLGI